MISTNVQKRTGTANFKSSIDRSIISEQSNKRPNPPVGFYDYKFDGVFARSKNEGFDLSKIQGRNQLQQKEDEDLFR